MSCQRVSHFFFIAASHNYAFRTKPDETPVPLGGHDDCLRLRREQKSKRGHMDGQRLSLETARPRAPVNIVGANEVPCRPHHVGSKYPSIVEGRSTALSLGWRFLSPIPHFAPW